MTFWSWLRKNLTAIPTAVSVAAFCSAVLSLVPAIIASNEDQFNARIYWLSFGILTTVITPSFLRAFFLDDLKEMENEEWRRVRKMRKHRSFAALHRELVAIVEIGGKMDEVLLLPSAQELLLSLPNLYEEYISLGNSLKSAEDDISRQLYRTGRKQILLNVKDATELYGKEHRRLLTMFEQGQIEAKHSAISSFPTALSMEDNLERAKALSQALDETDRAAPAGEDALSRQIDALEKESEIKSLPRERKRRKAE